MERDYDVEVSSDPEKDRQYTINGRQQVHCRVIVHKRKVFQFIQDVKSTDLRFNPYEVQLEQKASKGNILHFVITTTYTAQKEHPTELLQLLRAIGWKFSEQLALYLGRKQVSSTQHLNYHGDLECP